MLPWRQCRGTQNEWTADPNSRLKSLNGATVWLGEYDSSPAQAFPRHRPDVIACAHVASGSRKDLVAKWIFAGLIVGTSGHCWNGALGGSFAVACAGMWPRLADLRTRSSLLPRAAGLTERGV